MSNPNARPASLFASSRTLWSLAAGIAALACGSSDAESNYSDVVENASSTGGASSSGDIGSFGDGGVSSSSGSIPNDAACATSAANAELAKVNIIVMYDRSGSMGKPGEGDRTQKWDPVGAAMKDFFGSTASTGLAASLQYFPQDPPANVQTVAAYRAAVCDAAPYQVPAVPLQPLPSAAFAPSIDSMSPNGGTPTKGALDGALAFAQATAAAKPTEKVVVLLVTDGEPGGYLQVGPGQFVEMCTNNTIATVSSSAQAAFTATPAIPTYVIGIGGSLANLNSIANAGGTTSAILVQVGNPTDTRTKIGQALDTIRGQSIPCELALPAPPDGQKMNIDTVNVVLTKDGIATTLTYNKTCAGGTGWHYDDVDAPKKVILCDNECSAAKSGSSNVQVTFGCATNGGVIR